LHRSRCQACGQRVVAHATAVRNRRGSSAARSARGHHRGHIAASCRDSAALSAVEPAGDLFAL